jgi:CHAT domain-containing protein
MEWSASQQLRDTTRKQLVQPKEKQNIGLIQELKEVSDHLQQEESAVLKEIEEQYPRYAELMNPKPITLPELRSNIIQDHEILLEYVVTDEKTVIFIISKDNFKSITIDLPSSQLRYDIEQVRSSLMNPQDKFDTTIAYKLYTKLFQPAEEYITNKKVIYIVPDGPLYYLPFEILITSNESQDSSLNFLLADPHHYTFVYVPSASILSSIRRDSRWKQPRSNQNPVLAFGDPVYSKDELDLDNTKLTAMSQGAIDITRSLQNRVTGFEDLKFDRLPNTTKEILGIRDVYELPNDSHSQAIHLRLEALETKVKEHDLASSRYIHFATHGILGSEVKGAWQQPSLVLSLYGEEQDVYGTNKNDGFLQMDEIFNLTMNADLVTLSACQTALGKESMGEGLIGLTRAFLYAGTPSIVVSLWNVNDLSTPHFMEQFYRNLKGGMSKGKALREAKLDWFYQDEKGQDQKHRHPYYWANFILIGNWK